MGTVVFLDGKVFALTAVTVEVNRDCAQCITPPL